MSKSSALRLGMKRSTCDAGGREVSLGTRRRVAEVPGRPIVGFPEPACAGGRGISAARRVRTISEVGYAFVTSRHGSIRALETERGDDVPRAWPFRG